MVAQPSVLRSLIAKGTLNVFNILVPLLVMPYVYRKLGPDSMGNVEYGLTIFQYFGMLGLLGIYNYGLREVSAHRNSKGKVLNIYKNLFVIGLVSNLLFLLVYLGFVHAFIEDADLKLILYIFGGSFLAQIFYIEWINEAHEKFQFITIKTVVVRVISVGAILLLIQNSSDYYYYAGIIVVTLFFNNIISFFYAQRDIKLSVKDIFWGLKSQHYILPLLFILILNNTSMLYTLADRIMLGIYNSRESVAFYSIGQKIVEVTKALLLSIVFVTLPRLSLYLNDSKKLYEERVQRLMRLMLMIAMPVGIGMCMLSEQIVLLFAGKQYLAAIPAMRVFAVRIILLAVESILYNQIIFLHRKENILVVLNLICGGLNVALNFIFLKHLSPLVAISTTVLTEVLFEILCLVYIKQKLRITTGLFDKRNIKYVVISLLFIPVILLLKRFVDNIYVFVVASVAICSLMYILALLKSRDEIFLEIKRRFV